MAEATALKLTKVLKVSPEEVFKAWTDPAEIKKWYSPTGQVSIAESDANVGGKYRVGMVTPDGEHTAFGVYKELVPGKKIVMSFDWEGGSMGGAGETTVTIELEKVDEGTRLTLTHTNFANEAARDEHVKGWEAVLAQLEKLFA